MRQDGDVMAVVMVMVVVDIDAVHDNAMMIVMVVVVTSVAFSSSPMYLCVTAPTSRRTSHSTPTSPA